MRIKRWIIGTLILFPVLYLQSCCLIGLGIGAISDAHKKDSVFVPVARLAAVKNGENIAVALKDGRRLKGKFIRYRRGVQRDYATRYYFFVKNHRLENAMPRLFEKVSVLSGDTLWLKGQFLGFDKQNLFLLSTDQTEKRPELARLRQLRGTGRRTFSLQTIRAVVARADFPLFSETYLDRQATLVLMTGNNLQKFPAEAIVQVHLLPRKNGKLTGFLIGAGIDVALAVFTITQISREGLVPNMDLGPM